MPCYNPLRAFKIGLTNKGKDLFKICPKDTEVVVHKGDKWIPYGKRDVVNFQQFENVREYIEVPCGKCVGCRERQAKEWTDRILMELETAESAYFVTLTYDDQYLNYIGYTDPVDGVVEDIPTLNYRDVQLFLKQLRNTGQKIRYFAAGEYGKKSQRPHYHLIVFNLKLDDLKPYKVNFEGDMMYTSEYINKLWKKGYCVIGEVNKKTAGYTARYVLKKYENPISYAEQYGLEPERTMASKRPALGREFLEKNVEKFATQSKVAIFADGVLDQVSLPTYGKRLYKQLDLCQDKFEQKASENIQQIKNNRLELEKISHMSYKKELENKEYAKKQAIRRLVRKEL